MGERKKVFITGAAGRVGAALSEGLRNRYDLKLLYHPSRIPENRNEADDVVVSDMTDFDAMVEAAAGMDAIVHLALSKGRKGDTPLQRSRVTVDENIPGDFNIFEAARINSVPTIVYASTNHVSGRYENDGVLSRADAPVRPDLESCLARTRRCAPMACTAPARPLGKRWVASTPRVTESGYSVCASPIVRGREPMNPASPTNRGFPGG